MSEWMANTGLEVFITIPFPSVFSDGLSEKQTKIYQKQDFYWVLICQVCQQTHIYILSVIWTDIFVIETFYKLY